MILSPLSRERLFLVGDGVQLVFRHDKQRAVGGDGSSPHAAVHFVLGKEFLLLAKKAEVLKNATAQNRLY